MQGQEQTRWHLEETNWQIQKVEHSIRQLAEFCQKSLKESIVLNEKELQWNKN